jgi:signal transduction histidine kinase
MKETPELSPPRAIHELAMGVSPETPAVDLILLGRTKAAGMVISALVATFALLAFCGCIFDIPLLRNPTPWGNLTVINSAVCLFLVAIATLSVDKTRILLLAAGIILLADGTLTLCEWLFHWNAGIDQLLWTESHPPTDTPPGRAAILSTVIFITLGSGMISLRLQRFKFGQCCVVLSFMLGLISLYGHTFGFASFITFGSTYAIPLPVSLSATFLSIGILAVYSGKGIMPIFVSPNLGGRVARRLLPLILIGPVIGVATGMGVRNFVDSMTLVAFMSTVLPFSVWLVATTIDMLDRKSQQALKEALAMKAVAEESLEAKKRFLSTISHEVRTPMSSVIGLTELLSLQDLGQENNATVKTIMDSSERLLHLLNDLLDTARLESPKIELECRKFPLVTMLGEIKELVRNEAEKKGLHLSATTDESIPDYVSGDELRVKQVLLHLVFNAIKFTQKGSVHLDAAVKEKAPQRVVIRFTVTDTGPGLTLEAQSRIFESFEQVQDNTTQVRGGAGLGLSISRKLVQLMHGDIGVVSEPGRGASFWCELPFEPENYRN